MDQGVKLAAACGVLLFGVVVALVIPRDSSPTTNGAGADDPVTFQGHVPPPLSSGPAPKWLGADRRATTIPDATPQVATPRVVVQDPGNLGPLDPGGLPPDLERHYPQNDYSTTAAQDATSRWKTLINPNRPRPVARELMHTIVDGDTLEQLAERYLGSADRHLEIFEANRDVLTSPSILPIGAYLRIPSHSGRSPRTTDVRARRPMVPIGN